MQDSFVTCRTVIRLVEVRGTVRKWRGPVKSGEFFICIVSVRYRGWFEVKTSFFSPSGICWNKEEEKEGGEEEKKKQNNRNGGAKGKELPRRGTCLTVRRVPFLFRGWPSLCTVSKNLLLLISHSIPTISLCILFSFPPLWVGTFKNEQRF